MKKNVYLFISLFIICGLLYVGLYFFTGVFKKKTNHSQVEVISTKNETGIMKQDRENFDQEVSILLEKGYKVDEINKIYASMSKKNIEIILTIAYIDLHSFYGISNFDVSKTNRYETYQVLKGIEMKDAVTQVNLNLDEPYYTNIEIIKDPSSLQVLVNKFHALPSDYVPSDLIPIPSYPNYKMREEAAKNIEKLFAAALIDGVHLVPFSTYRSYDYQNGLYQKYLKVDSQSDVDTYSARPGHSEHQTGYAADVRSKVLNDNLTSSDYTWMQNNSYRYGFIIRYPKNNSFITGYKEEPWHIRYIGIQDATKVHDLNITYDEYYDLNYESY